MAESSAQVQKTSENGLNRQFKWYKPGPERIKEPTRTLLEEYSKIPDDQIVNHVTQVRDRAFAVFPYPCIGSFRFLEITIYNSPAYPEILTRLKSGDKYLDLACALGQDIRHLIFKGATPENLYGSDLRPEFFNIGCDLFLDRSTIKATFIASDIFDDTSALYQQLLGKLDIINAASFFHLFDWDSQVNVAKCVVKLLRPVPGSLLVGRQSANVRPGKRERSEIRGEFYRHNAESWKRLWGQVGQETRTDWVVDITEIKQEELQTHVDSNEGAFKMQFVIRRL